VAKILIIRFSSIGDIVLASPVFRCVKNQLPNAEIHFVTKLSFKMVTEHNPYINRFFYYDGHNLDDLITTFKQEKFDYVIDLHRNFRSAKIKNALKAKRYTIDKLSIQKFLLTKLNINIMPNRHITQRSLDAVSALGVKDDGLGLDYFITKEDAVNVNDIPAAHHAGFIAVVIGASYNTKKMPVHKLQELCNKLEHPIILLGGKEDAAAGNEIASIDKVKIYNACGKFRLNESADIIRQAKLVISHDTGLQYIACAYKKQVIAIWGATSPALNVEPYYGSIFMQQQTKPIYENVLLNLRCQPCSKYGTNTCPLEHFNCMEKQDIDLIVQKVYQRIGRA
jgi:ADP-heptose:LPS heptosyltransferase